MCEAEPLPELPVWLVTIFLVVFAVNLIAALIGGLIYSKCPKCRPPLEDAARRRSGGCRQSGYITFWGCCCPNVLWSAMASSPKSRFCGLTFWQMLFLRAGLAVGVVVLLLLFPALLTLRDKDVLAPGSVLLMFIFQLLVAFLTSIPFIVMNVLHRQQLRQKFGLEHSTCSTVFKDVYIWLCCQPCATIQEALQVGYTGDPTLEGPLNDDSARNVPLQMRMVVDL